MTKTKGTLKPLFSRKKLTRGLLVIRVRWLLRNRLYQLTPPGDKTNAEVAV